MQTGFPGAQLRRQDAPNQVVVRNVSCWKQNLQFATLLLRSLLKRNTTTHHAPWCTQKQDFLCWQGIQSNFTSHTIFTSSVLRPTTSYLWISQVKLQTFQSLTCLDLHSYAATSQHPEILTHTTLAKSHNHWQTQVYHGGKMTRKCPQSPSQ